MGFPNLNEIKETATAVSGILQGLDKEKLKLINHLVDTVMVLQQTGGMQPLQMVSQVVQMVATQPSEKLDQVDKIICDIKDTVKAIEKLLACLPPDLLKGINLGDLGKEIQKAIGEAQK
jgi:hypothetical protein